MRSGAGDWPLAVARRRFATATRRWSCPRGPGRLALAGAACLHVGAVASRPQPAAASRSPSHGGPAGRLAWGGRAGRDASSMRARHALPRFGVSLAGVVSCRVTPRRAWRGVASGRDVQRSAAAGGGRACRDLEPRGGPS